MKILTLLLIIVLASCSTEQADYEQNITEEHVIRDTSLFLSHTTHDFVSRPGGIKAGNEGLYIFDNAHGSVTRVDRQGNPELSFGQHGEGPGEFESPGGFWVMEDGYLVYDYGPFEFIKFNRHGEEPEHNVLEENPIHDRFPHQFPLTLDAVSPEVFLVPSGGREGSLIAVVDVEADTLEFLGEAVDDFVEDYDYEEVNEAYLTGEIPDILRNSVMPGNNTSGIFLYQMITGILEKYDHSGNLLWQKDLRIPAQQGLFDQIAEANRESADNPEEPPVSYSYAIDMEVREEGVAVLLNTPEGAPLKVAWVPNDGEYFDMVTFEEFNPQHISAGMGDTFTISEQQSEVFFLNPETGEIYKAEWPI